MRVMTCCIRSVSLKKREVTVALSRVEVNVLAPLALTRRLLAPLRRGPLAGRVVFVGSMASVFGGPGQLPYAATKAAVDGAADVLRREARWPSRAAPQEERVSGRLALTP